MTADGAWAALPEPVRRRALDLATGTLGDFDAETLPGPLRPVARFRPESRARRAAVPMALALQSDEAFRRRVAGRLRATAPDLCAGIEVGDVPPLLDPVEAAAYAHLLGAESASALAAAAAAAEAERTAADAVAALTADRDRLAAELEAARTALAEARAATPPGRSVDADDVEALRRDLRAAQAAARAGAEDVAAARAALERGLGEAEAAGAARDAELQRVRSRLSDVESELAAARAARRAGRALLDARTRLLLDTLLGAARGLEQELAPAPTEVRPADTAGGRLPGSAAPTVADSWARSDDPAHLERLLALPRVHLVVDGYNVTKTGFGELPLADQRDRLVTALATLAARTRAEVTAVFDGAALDDVPATAVVRGVRVLFSEAGQTADALIGRLVGAEPAGRVVVVVSTDREVGGAARRAGAHHADAAALLRLLGR